MDFPISQPLDVDAWYELLETYVDDMDDQPDPFYWTDNDDSALYESRDGEEIKLASYDFENQVVTFYEPMIGIHREPEGWTDEA